MSVQNG
ncbi:hypothetical protein YPPY14_1199, partial [Yersinia pestis PY-14]